MVKGRGMAKSMAPPSPPCKETQLREATTFRQSIHRREIGRRGHLLSMDRILLALLALTVLLVPVASAATPPASVGRADQEKFFVAAGRPGSVDFFVPSRGHASFTFHVEAGSAVDFVVEGPGACQTERVSLVAAGPFLSQTIDVGCNVPRQMVVELELRVTAGALRGYVESAGADRIP